MRQQKLWEDGRRKQKVAAASGGIKRHDTRAGVASSRKRRKQKPEEGSRSGRNVLREQRILGSREKQLQLLLRATNMSRC